MNKKGILEKTLKTIYYVFVTALCLVAFFIIVLVSLSQFNANNPNYRPLISMYTIVSPSMTPVINVYDVVVNVKVDNPEDIEVGDIITYVSDSPESEGMKITHRVVSIIKEDSGEIQFITQGDNNSSPDTLSVSPDAVIGKEVLIIPKLGKIQFMIANQKSWLLLLLIPIIIYIIKDSKKLVELLGLRRKVDKAAGIITLSSSDIKRENKEERKALIKLELENKEIIKQSRIKSPDEPKSFIEENVETVLNIKENKYLKTYEEHKRKLEKELQNKKSVAVPAKYVVSKALTPKELSKLNPDLAKEIKIYDDQIDKLSKMIKNLEQKKKIVTNKNNNGPRVKIVSSLKQNNQKEENIFRTHSIKRISNYTTKPKDK